MNIKSYTFQASSIWSAETEGDFLSQSCTFFEDLRKQNLQVLGCLQSFVFPSDYTEDVSVQVSEAVSAVYKKMGLVLLGGDTSSGDSLVITLVALIK